ncbi:YihY/virulence factor BrkB family protein [Sphingoaurantiacus capsulatus]|uniref:YihY/virulence factor BrkB family protein n=1 Tax=Sphingoaurantiacus capsulatus TaxID=1771310 RepID=A0ABV7X7I0_9SPHN
MAAAPDSIPGEVAAEIGRFARALGYCRNRFSRAFAIGSRVLSHTWEDGFIHAGNLAYLSLLTLFPFFIIVAAIAGVAGQSDDVSIAINNFLLTLPKDVADLLAKPISDVLTARSGQLLTFGIVVGLWSVGSFIETIRDILRRAYEVRGGGLPIWRYRLGSFALIIGSVILMLIAFTAQVILTGVEQFVEFIIPWADDALSLIAWGRIAPIIALFVALYILFVSLTPMKFRAGCPKWPGAVLTTAVWILTTMLLPLVLGSLAPYDLTYGSLAGVMISLIFFWIVGLGFVLGAELNAALAQTPKNRLEEAEDKPTGCD